MMEESYYDRTRQSYWFAKYGIEPQWRGPGARDVDGFVHDEVVRQGHDTTSKWDGGRRIKWMRHAWEYAQEHADRTPDIGDILLLGSMVEPEENTTAGFRTMNVFIGERTGAAPSLVPRFMAHLVLRADAAIENRAAVTHEGKALLDEYDRTRDDPESFPRLVRRVETPDDWYLAYEWIHPFGDGNGRSGKILHNWLLGTLDDPALVRDWFGGGNP